jgi:hypothetical protein
MVRDIGGFHFGLMCSKVPRFSLDIWLDSLSSSFIPFLMFCLCVVVVVLLFLLPPRRFLQSNAYSIFMPGGMCVSD